MQLIERHIVPSLEQPTRLQDYGFKVFRYTTTKSGLKKAIKKGQILVNGKKASTAIFLTGGENIELFETDSTYKEFKLSLEVIFEDDFLAIIYKPAGILVSGNSFATIDNALSQNLKKSTQTDAVRPRPVHRLDYPTSGLLLIGKTNSSIIALNKLFENKDITKTYHAVTIGKMKKAGEIEFPINHKNAFTQYKLVETVNSKRFEYLNLVELHPKTGRKHQLRKHLFGIGHPILGDQEYFNDLQILKGKGLYLHASSLKFRHPKSNLQINITKELPKKFFKIFPTLQQLT